MSIIQTPPPDVAALAAERENYVRGSRPDRVIPVDTELAARGWCVNTAGHLVPLVEDRRAVTADPDAASKAEKAAAAAAKKAEADAVAAERAAEQAKKLAAAGRNEAEEARLAKLQAQGRATGEDEKDDEKSPARRPRERAVNRPAETA